MPIKIIDNFELSAAIPIDLRYTADTYHDVSAYWYEGMQVYQYSDKQIWFYNGIIWQSLSTSTSNPFDVLWGGTIGIDSDDIFNGNVTIDDTLYGGTY